MGPAVSNHCTLDAAEPKNKTHGTYTPYECTLSPQKGVYRSVAQNSNKIEYVYYHSEVKSKSRKNRPLRQVRGKRRTVRMPRGFPHPRPCVLEQTTNTTCRAVAPAVRHHTNSRPKMPQHTFPPLGSLCTSEGNLGDRTLSTHTRNLRKSVSLISRVYPGRQRHACSEHPPHERFFIQQTRLVRPFDSICGVVGTS